ncbi:MAG TPA: metal-dependent transcriptional regulator [Bacillota bacterium]|nr:metal-dependent transcriptional regulator [Bacillota bacterium]
MSQVTDSAENYLESIFVLKKRKDCVRSIDIVRFLDFSKPSVSIAMRKLRESGHIEMAGDGCITLLPKGEKVARETYERHVLMRAFLQHIGVSPDTADQDACKIEHVISKETFEAMQAYAAKIRLLPCGRIGREGDC